jgi:queuine tRNA-ribosyltransferase/7-cyano-7-deazaguanine tRNA-ribosyltransferase
VPVATQAVVKTLNAEQVASTGAKLLIANTFHLHLKPGEQVVKAAGGVHRFANWPGAFMTDSGGFQVFSLGFGRDFNHGKIAREPARPSIAHGQQPKLLKITNTGVWFTSPVDGRKLFLGPKESIRIQEALGADIIFAFDECTSPLASEQYTRGSLERTHAWARECLRVKRSGQALYGIVQGGKFKRLRVQSAKDLATLPFDGYGIGGEFGSDKKTMVNMIGWVNKELPPEKPRHLLGIGFPDDIVPIVKAGVDTFDCIVPTNQARHGMAFVSSGKLDLTKQRYLKDKAPLDPHCACSTCQGYQRRYIAHLVRAHELTALSLLTIHNLTWFNTYVAEVRKRIKQGKL